jgi:hypothetical protein
MHSETCLPLDPKRLAAIMQPWCVPRLYKSMVNNGGLGGDTLANKLGVDLPLFYRIHDLAHPLP